MTNLISIWESRLPKENNNLNNIKLIIGEVIDHYDKLENAKAASNDKINFLFDAKQMEVKPIEVNLTESVYWPNNSYDTFIPITIERINKVCDEKIACFNSALLEIEKLHTENLVAIENNTKIREGLMDLLLQLGMKTTQRTYGRKTPQSRTNTYYDETMWWPLEMKTFIKIDDGYQSIVDSIKRKIEIVEKLRKDKIAEFNKLEVQRLAAERTQADLMELARYQVKYNLEATANWYEVMDKIQSMDGYLDDVDLCADYDFVETKISRY
jgi:hypothetical protein